MRRPSVPNSGSGPVGGAIAVGMGLGLGDGDIVDVGPRGRTDVEGVWLGATSAIAGTGALGVVNAYAAAPPMPRPSAIGIARAAIR